MSLFYTFNFKTYFVMFNSFDCLVGFYGILTLVGYLMPNPVYTYIKYLVKKY